MDRTGAAVEHVDITPLLGDGVEPGQNGFPLAARPGGSGVLNGDAECRRVRRRDRGEMNLRHAGGTGFGPAGVADVDVVLEVIPLAADKLRVVVLHQRGVVGIVSAGHIGEVVGTDAALLGVKLVLRAGDIHFVEVGAGFDGEEHQFVEGVLLVLRQEPGECFCPGGQCVVVVGDGLRLVVVRYAVGTGGQAFRLAPSVELRIERHDVGDFVGVLGAELARSPQARVFAHGVVGPPVRIPAEVEKVIDGKFNVLELADIDDPYPIGTVLFGQRHLVPDAGDGAGVDPAVIGRSAVVVEVIVDTRATRTFAFLGGGKAADVPVIVFSPEQGDVVGSVQASGLVVVLDFLVKAPHLREPW